MHDYRKYAKPLNRSPLRYQLRPIRRGRLIGFAVVDVSPGDVKLMAKFLVSDTITTIKANQLARQKCAELNGYHI
jgi:hypothetical protein